MLDAEGEQRYVVCNADEGDPFVLIEGMAIAALAVGAQRGYIYCRSEYPQAIDSLEGKRGMVRFRPPLPERRGCKQRRTGYNLALRLRDHKGRHPALSDGSRRDEVTPENIGGFRSGQGTEDFATLHSSITTAKKQEWNIIEILIPADQIIAALKIRLITSWAVT